MRFTLVAVVGALVLAAPTLDAGQVPLEVVAVSGQNAPAGGRFVRFRTPVIDSRGRAFFHAQTDAIHPTRGHTIEGVYFADENEVRVLARPDMGVPGTTELYYAANPPLVNGTGQFLIEALLGFGELPTGSAIVLGQVNDFARTIVRTGDSAPGTSTTFKTLDLTPGALASSGQTAFLGFLDQVDDLTKAGIWTATLDEVQLVARAGAPAPGTGEGVVFNTSQSNSSTAFGRPSVNASGQVAFQGFLSGEGVTQFNDSGIWAGRAGQIRLVARTDDPTPEGSGGGFFFGHFSPPVIMDTGEIGFEAVMSPNGNENGPSSIWKGRPGALNLVAREGSEAPGGGVFIDLYPAFSSLGKVAFHASLANPTVPPPTLSGHFGIYAGEGDDVRLVARTSQIAPGINEPFTVLYVPSVNNAGQVVFYWLLGDPLGDSKAGIWATDPQGQLLLIARAGEVLDLGDGVQRTIRELNLNAGAYGTELGGFVAMNDFGQITFGVTFTDGSGAILTTAVPEPGGIAMLAAGGLLALIRMRRSRSVAAHTRTS
jgi:hypothetical protein